MTLSNWQSYTYHLKGVLDLYSFWFPFVQTCYTIHKISVGWVGFFLYVCWVPVCVLIKTLLFLLTQLPIHIVFLLPFILPPFCSTISPAILPLFTVAPFYYSSFSSILQHCFQHISFYLLTFSWLCLINILAGEKKKTQWQEQATHIFMWECVCCEQWVTLEKAQVPLLPPPSFLSWPCSGGN